LDAFFDIIIIRCTQVTFRQKKSDFKKSDFGVG
jgi:hypothetical protein